jgi:hypothetical protein
MKFTLKCEQFDYNNYTGEVKGVNKVITYEFQNPCLSEALENIEAFLRGSDFVFDGYIDVVPNEEDKIWPEDDSEQDDTVLADAVDLPGWPFPIEQKPV